MRDDPISSLNDSFVPPRYMGSSPPRATWAEWQHHRRLNARVRQLERVTRAQSTALGLLALGFTLDLWRRRHAA